MENFAFYFILGWKHIISWGALDHILFIVTLMALYLLKDSKQILILITAFTVGHAVTLFLSVYDFIRISSTWVEFCIAVTIMVTAMFNILQYKKQAVLYRMHYLMALFFGMVHGLGFAGTIRFILAKDQVLFFPLMGFNTGLEAGQLVIAALVLITGSIMVQKVGMKRKLWIGLLSGIAFMLSLNMAIPRWPF